MSSELEAKLQRARALFATGGQGSKEEIYELAEAKYEPAKQFLLELLDSPEWVWRDTGLAAFAEWQGWDSQILQRVGDVLRGDPEENARASAAGLLGGAGNPWPNSALEHALDHDPSRRVRTTAFESVLSLMGMPWPDVQAEAARVKGGELDPTLATTLEVAARWKQQKNRG